MKDSINLVGYFNKHKTSIELLDYHYNPNLIPKSLINCDLFIEISRYSEKRSLKQNSLLFGYAYPIIVDFLKNLTGVEYTKDYVHIHNMTEIQGFKYTTVEILGREVLSLDRPSSSNFSKSEFSTRYEMLQNWWADQGCLIPDLMEIKTLEPEELFDDSRMPFGPYRGKRMDTVPEKYLKELYNNQDRYCSEAVRKYIIDTLI